MMVFVGLILPILAIRLFAVAAALCNYNNVAMVNQSVFG
jgi:hypothetical protein